MRETAPRGHPPRTPRGTPRSARPDGLSGGGAQRFQPQIWPREPAQRPQGASCSLARPRRAPAGPSLEASRSARPRCPRRDGLPTHPAAGCPDPNRSGFGRFRGCPPENAKWRSESSNSSRNMPLGGSKGRDVGPLLCLASTGQASRAEGSGKGITGRTALELRGPGVDRRRTRPQVGSDLGLGSQPRAGGRAPSRRQAASLSVFWGCGPGGWSVSKALRSPASGRNGDGEASTGLSRLGAPRPRGVQRLLGGGGMGRGPSRGADGDHGWLHVPQLLCPYIFASNP